MINQTENIRKLILYSDLEMLGSIISDIEKLISQNPFSERITYLINHQELSQKPVRNLKGELKAPNCIGTAFWIARVSSLNYPYHAYENELDKHMRDENDKRDTLIKTFYPNPNNKIPGAFIFSYGVEAEDWHAGIYLGSIGTKDISFAQHGVGGLFGPQSLAMNYANPQYYIPDTLSQLRKN